MDTDPAHWIATLGGSHDRLRSIVEPLDAERLQGPSYASEWSIAQVLSHLGSGAEIFSLFLDVGLSGAPAPGREQFEPIWASWNGRSPAEQAADALTTDAALVERMASLDPATRDSLHLAMFGMDIDMIALSRMRLGEHAVHTWDIAVALDESATVAPEAVAMLVDTLDQLVVRLGKPAHSYRVLISTTDPDRDFVLDAGEAVSLTAGRGDGGDGAGAGGDVRTLRLPAEALLRLVYGRLDPAHTPAGVEGDADLDVLRSVFPGF